VSSLTETRLLIVRHPETVANVSGRFVGQGESAYTAQGRRQARRLPLKLSRFKPDEVWSSPLLRASVVAERASRLANVPLRIDPRLTELDFGSAHGLTWEEITEAGIPFNYRAADEPVAPGGESRDALEARVGQCFDEMCAVGGRYVVVAHAGVMRAALSHLLGLAGEGLWIFHIHNAQMARVRVFDGHAQLEEYVQG
jgi:broad specificity phosphatase PhoE